MQQQHHYTQYSFLLQHLTSHSNTKVTTKRKRLFRSVNSENFVDLPSLVFIIVVVVIAIAKAKAKQCDFYLLKVFAIAFSTNSTKNHHDHHQHHYSLDFLAPTIFLAEAGWMDGSWIWPSVGWSPSSVLLKTKNVFIEMHSQIGFLLQKTETKHLCVSNGLWCVFLHSFVLIFIFYYIFFLILLWRRFFSCSIFLFSLRILNEFFVSSSSSVLVFAIRF